MWTLQIFVDNGYFRYLCRYPMRDDFLELRSQLLFKEWIEVLANVCLALKKTIISYENNSLE
jgi:hypothetical protein